MVCTAAMATGMSGTQTMSPTATGSDTGAMQAKSVSGASSA